MCHSDLYARPEVFPLARSQPGVRGDLSPSAAWGRGQGTGLGQGAPRVCCLQPAPVSRPRRKLQQLNPSAFAISTSALASFLSPLTPQIKG